MGPFLATTAALWILYFVEVRSLTVPAAQQIGGNDAGSGTNLPSPYSNLTAPPPIPGFEVRPRFDPNPSLIAWQIYTNLIELMVVYAKMAYDTEQSKVVSMSGHRYEEQVTLAPIVVHGHSRIQTKHVVQAINEAGKALAARPITRPGYVSRMVAGLYLQNEVVGFLKLQHEDSTVLSAANDTLRLPDDVGSTGTLQLAQDVRPAALNERSGEFVFPNNPRYILQYHVENKRAPLQDIFTAFLEAMADAAPYDVDAVEAHVTSIGVSGNFALNMHGTIQPSRLSWGNIIDTLKYLWEKVLSKHNFNEIEWSLSYDGVNIGAGFMLVSS